MALEADSAYGTVEAQPRLRGFRIAFWGWRAAAAIELGLFAAGVVMWDFGRGLAVAAAGLFLCAFISFLALQSSESPMGVAARRLARKKVAMAAIAFICLFYLAGILAPVLPIRSYTAQDLSLSLKGPSLDHPFGTDRLGRDLLSRCIWSSQTTVIVTAATLLVGGLFLAIGLGLLSGYAGGWVDTAIMRTGDLFAGLPTLLMLILINATLKDRIHSLGHDVEKFTGIGGIVRSGAPDYFLIFGALAMFSWVGTARIIRSRVLALRETEFILAARCVGASTPRILLRHLLPNVSNIIIVGLSLGLSGIAGSEIALTFFGVGVQAPHPSYGALIFEGSGIRQLNATPWLLLFPVGIVATLYFAFNLLGDALTDILTPRAQ
jgi:oligopeptide transport system permease protein